MIFLIHKELIIFETVKFKKNHYLKTHIFFKYNIKHKDFFGAVFIFYIKYQS